MTEDVAAEDGEQPKLIPRVEVDPSSSVLTVGRDDAGIREAQLIGSGISINKIKKRSEERESDRAKKFKDNFERMSIVALWLGFGAFIGLFSVWAFHLVAPECRHFLTDKALDKLQLVVTGGFVTGVVSGH